MLWLFVLGWLTFVGILRWVEFRGPWWGMFAMPAHWVPTFPPYYFFLRWQVRRGWRGRAIAPSAVKSHMRRA
jgi:hypothetical protein